MAKSFEVTDIVRFAHSVATFDRQVLINVGDGTLLQQRGGEQIAVELVYARIRRVYSSQHRVIARRRQSGKPLLVQ